MEAIEGAVENGLSMAYDAVVGATQEVAEDAPDYSAHYGTYEPSQYWTADPKGVSKIVFAESGMGSKAKVPAKTLSEVFRMAVQRNPTRVALRTEAMPAIGKGEEIPPPMPLKRWKKWTHQEYYDDCRNVAKAMISLGFQAHDAANILGFNSPEWFIGAMSAILAGGKCAGIYPSDNEEQIQFKVDHSNGSIMFVETAADLEKVKTVIDDLPYLKVVVTWACDHGENLARSDGSKVETISFEGLVKVF